MVVVPQQAIRHAAHAESRKRLPKEVEERLAILVVREDASLLVTAGENVMQEAWGVEAERTAHTSDGAIPLPETSR